MAHPKHSSKPFSIPAVVSAHITLADLDDAWIGVGAALEWIAMRGQAIPASEYDQRSDAAAEAFITTLADMPPEIAESLVRGQPESGPGSALVAIPAGIWSVTAGHDLFAENKSYQLLATDDANEWEGAILGLAGGYRRVQLRTSFLREHWPPDHPAIEPKRKRKRFAIAELRQLIETVVAKTPPELAPLSKTEIAEIARKCMPQAPRDKVRDITRDLGLEAKTGPRGPRDPERPKHILEFGEKMLFAKLRN